MICFGLTLPWHFVGFGIKPLPLRGEPAPLQRGVWGEVGLDGMPSRKGSIPQNYPRRDMPGCILLLRLYFFR
jgi:hypothetical protein